MRRFSAILMSAILTLIASAAMAAPIVTGDLLELIDPERAAYLRDSVCTQVSSFDPAGGNDDGFSGGNSFIRMEGKEFVIFDAQGPGCIYRLWSANPLNGWVKFYFDGEEKPRLQVDRFESLFSDKLYPFVPPLSQHFLGGWCSYVPMPFAKSLKIVARGPVRFLQITWHKFSSPEGIVTFDPNYTPEQRMKLLQVKKAWTRLGESPMPLPATSVTLKKAGTISANSAMELARVGGAGEIRAIHLKITGDDPKYLRKSLLLVNVDGNKSPNVYSPVGDFFLDPFGGQKAQSLLAGKANDAYYSYWVMPYSKGASASIRNDSNKSVKFEAELVYQPMDKLPENMGRFFAWWHRQDPTLEGELFPILDAKGRGQWCGVSHAMQGGGEGLGFLEGDEMAWMDDRDNTLYNGTGTEDYFNGGWYFGGTGSAAFYGCGWFANEGKCHAYRLQMTDLVPFQQKARIGIEHGHANSIPADYAGVTYWYAAPGTTHGFKPTDVVDRVDSGSAANRVTEAETAFDAKSGGKIVNDSNETYQLSRGKSVSTTSSAVGSSFGLTIDVPEKEAYRTQMAFLCGPKMGIAEVSVDGIVISEKLDTYTAAYKTRVRKSTGVTPELTPGRHVLKVTSVGKNAASKGASIVVDFITVQPYLLFEAEKLQVTGKSDVGVDTQSLGGEYSDGAQLIVRGTKPGDFATVKFSLLKSGSYPVSVFLSKAKDYGIVKFKLDGKQIGSDIDCYRGGLKRELVSLGDAALSVGDHEFTIEIIGKNEQSGGYLAGVDILKLK